MLPGTSSGLPSHERALVSGVPSGTTEDELRAAFAREGIRAGCIEFVVDRATGARRHFAFVEVETRPRGNLTAEGLAAITVNGEVLSIQWVGPPPARRGRGTTTH